MPPRAISELFEFWCLIAGESEPFSADGSFNWNVNQMKKAIQQQRSVLRNCDTIDLDLWKINDSPVIEPLKTLGDRLPFPITNFSVILDEPTRKLSDVFPAHLRPIEDHVHFVVQMPRAAVERVTKKQKLERTPTQGKQWSVCGAIDRHLHYYVDPATQAETQRCLDSVDRRDFCLLVGSRASGKSTRLFRIKTQLDDVGVWSLYVSLQGLNLEDITGFWESFGRTVSHDARIRGISFPEVKISNKNDFLMAFHVNHWSQKRLVLLLDDLSVLYTASAEVRNQCLCALREIKDNRISYAVTSVMATGTFSAVHLNPTDNGLSPFNVATHVQNPNFTLHETRSLFRQFMENTGINVEDDVVEDVWARTGGHPGMICLCGCTISQNKGSLVRNGGLTYQDWFEFSEMTLYEEISSYKTFRSMIKSLYSPSAMNAVRLLRSDFLGYPGDVTLLDFQDQCLANFLTAEGVLFKPERGLPTYRMTSALVDGLVRRTVIVNLFPNAPQVNPTLDESGQIDFLSALREALKSFDKEHICMAPSRSFKLSKVKVNGSRDAQVPRASVYDSELMRILSNWLQKHHGWRVTSQWHLKNPFGKHKFTDVVLEKPGCPTIVLKLVATGDEQFVNLHINKTPEYMKLLKAQNAWIIHFTREDQYVPVWQSDRILDEGVNLVHIWHTAEFTNLKMIAKWRDGAGIRRSDTHWEAISL